MGRRGRGVDKASFSGAPRRAANGRGPAARERGWWGRLTGGSKLALFLAVLLVAGLITAVVLTSRDSAKKKEAGRPRVSAPYKRWADDVTFDVFSSRVKSLAKQTADSIVKAQATVIAVENELSAYAAMLKGRESTGVAVPPPVTAHRDPSRLSGGDGNTPVTPSDGGAKKTEEEVVAHLNQVVAANLPPLEVSRQELTSIRRRVSAAREPSGFSASYDSLVAACDLGLAGIDGSEKALNMLRDSDPESRRSARALLEASRGKLTDGLAAVQKALVELPTRTVSPGGAAR